MNIAFAIEHFSPEQGGAERYAWNFAHWLARSGHTVDVFARRAPERAPFVREIKILPARSGMFETRQAAFARLLSAELGRRKYDIVQGFNHVWPCDVLRLGGGVHLAFEHWNAMSARGPMARCIKTLSYRLLPHYAAQRANEFRQFDDKRRQFIAVSRRVADDMARHYPARRSQIHLVRNGVDLSIYNPAAAAAKRTATRAELGVDPGTLLYVFISNNYRLKGLAELIAALSAARPKLGAPFQLLVVGRDKPDAYRKLAKRMGVEDVTKFGGGTRDSLSIYGAADVLLHPTYYDACANVCLEAMACGLPVLTSRNNGASEVMTDGSGCVLVDMPCSMDQLAQAVLRVSDSGFRVGAKETQWRLAQRLTAEDNFKSVMSLYEKIARG